MSQAAPATTAVPKEKTFSSYNDQQGKAYAEVRRHYHPNVYKAVIDHHTSSGGKLNTLLDVGCGPGLVIKGLASQFNHAIGLDPSEGMLHNANSMGFVTSTSEAVRFDISTAEELGANVSPPILDSSIDLITAGNAAHWFDMAGFWPAAARVLKPGGSVALWTSGAPSTHPSMPNAEAIQSVLREQMDLHLTPYYEPGNLLTRNGYADLPLPWTLEQPVAAFDKKDFFRKDFDPGEDFFLGNPEVDLDMLEKMLATGSAVTRWHQAHPEDVGTERDIVKMLRRDIERLLHEAGVKPGEEKVRGAVHGVLLMVKKKEKDV